MLHAFATETKRRSNSFPAQRKAAGLATRRRVPPIVHDVLRSPGRPLNTPARALMEARFGCDFGGVRVHTDARAAESAKSVDAFAYTVGRNVVSDRGMYAPQTAAGQRLLAHELAHLVQQRSSAGDSTPSTCQSADSSSTLEKEADRAADSAGAAGRPRLGTSGPALLRFSHAKCSEDDLKDHVWPGDWAAGQMVKKAIRVLDAGSRDPKVWQLLKDYFKVSVPPPGSIPDLYLLPALSSAFRRLDDAFSDNTYKYKCEDECKGTNNAWTRGGPIHLCMNSGIRNWTAECIGRAIVHEFLHKYEDLDDPAYCNHGCGCHPCSDALTPKDAANNADSYACFAFSLYSLDV